MSGRKGHKKGNAAKWDGAADRDRVLSLIGDELAAGAEQLGKEYPHVEAAAEVIGARVSAWVREHLTDHATAHGLPLSANPPDETTEETQNDQG